MLLLTTEEQRRRGGTQRGKLLNQSLSVFCAFSVPLY